MSSRNRIKIFNTTVKVKKENVFIFILKLEFSSKTKKQRYNIQFIKWDFNAIHFFTSKM